MNLSRPFVRRPIGTVLLTVGIALAGIAGFFALPVSPLPQIDLPVIQVNANMPGASPDTMASSVATPLERHLGTIAGVNEMTSTSSVGATRVTLQFDLSRDIDGAARDVQAAINAARIDLPATLRSNPTYRKANPADGAGDDPGAHLEEQDAGPDLRRGFEHHRPAPAAGQRRGRRAAWRRHAAGGAHRAQAVRAQPVRHQRRGRARGDPGE